MEALTGNWIATGAEQTIPCILWDLPQSLNLELVVSSIGVQLQLLFDVSSKLPSFGGNELLIYLIFSVKCSHDHFASFLDKIPFLWQTIIFGVSRLQLWILCVSTILPSLEFEHGNLQVFMHCNRASHEKHRKRGRRVILKCSLSEQRRLCEVRGSTKLYTGCLAATVPAGLQNSPKVPSGWLDTHFLAKGSGFWKFGTRFKERQRDMNEGCFCCLQDRKEQRSEAWWQRFQMAWIPGPWALWAPAIAQTRVAFLAWLSLIFLVMSILSSSYQVSHWKETTLVSIEIQRQHEHRHGFCRRQLDHWGLAVAVFAQARPTTDTWCRCLRE